MSTEKRSFWSSLPGMVTGIAGVVGAIVGVISVLIALGVIGDSKSSPTVTTLSPSDAPGATGGGAGRNPGNASGEGSFTVDSRNVNLTLAKSKGSVTVSNTGSALLKIDTPQISGPDKAQFTVSATGCSSLAARKTCSIDVTFTGALNATATMTVTADKADPTTVALTGSL